MCIGSCYKFTRMAHLNTLPYCDRLITYAYCPPRSRIAADDALEPLLVINLLERQVMATAIVAQHLSISGAVHEVGGFALIE